ncbi:hypothetical protein [Nocardiopsis sp. FIRDI 009]|uniref:hypothetical protein n=1 Tax=Nocardiopsis sp. FIRDI 009 TaxID=714197 RepID=UPI000E27EBB2|nr:hypothetical protein [Nocardiopsis sp. FIRDI 009]
MTQNPEEGGRRHEEVRITLPGGGVEHARMLAPGIAVTPSSFRSVVDRLGIPDPQRPERPAGEDEASRQRRIDARQRKLARTPPRIRDFTRYTETMLDTLGTLPSGRNLREAVGGLVPIPGNFDPQNPPLGIGDFFDGLGRLDRAGGAGGQYFTREGFPGGWHAGPGQVRVLVCDGGPDTREARIAALSPEHAKDGRGSCCVVSLPHVAWLETDGQLEHGAVLLGRLLSRAGMALSGRYDPDRIVTAYVKDGLGSTEKQQAPLHEFVELGNPTSLGTVLEAGARDRLGDKPVVDRLGLGKEVKASVEAARKYSDFLEEHREQLFPRDRERWGSFIDDTVDADLERRRDLLSTVHASVLTRELDRALGPKWMLRSPNGPHPLRGNLAIDHLVGTTEVRKTDLLNPRLLRATGGSVDATIRSDLVSRKALTYIREGLRALPVHELRSMLGAAEIRELKPALKAMSRLQRYVRAHLAAESIADRRGKPAKPKPVKEKEWESDPSLTVGEAWKYCDSLLRHFRATDYVQGTDMLQRRLEVHRALSKVAVGLLMVAKGGLHVTLTPVQIAVGAGSSFVGAAVRAFEQPGMATAEAAGTAAVEVASGVAAVRRQAEGLAGAMSTLLLLGMDEFEFLGDLYERTRTDLASKTTAPPTLYRSALIDLLHERPERITADVWNEGASGDGGASRELGTPPRRDRGPTWLERFWRLPMELLPPLPPESRGFPPGGPREFGE